MVLRDASASKNSGTAGPDKYHPCYSLAMSKDKDIIAMLFCTQEIWREATELFYLQLTMLKIDLGCIFFGNLFFTALGGS